MDVLFAVSASADPVFTNMKNTAKDIVNTYGISTIKYSTMVFGKTAETVFDFSKSLTTKASVMSAIDNATRVTTTPPSLTEALIRARNIFNTTGRSNVKRVLVVMMEENSTQTAADLVNALNDLKSLDVLVIAVSFGNIIRAQQLDLITLNIYYTMMVSPNESPRQVGLGIMSRALKGKDK